VGLRDVASLPLGTTFGEFELRAFELASGEVYLALVRGEIGDGRSVLTRLHSECLTGDALGSLRCDCGTQLRQAAREIAAEGRGVLVYATDHEGRGIGLVNKLRAYMLQEDGEDTIDANRHLGFPPDGRSYDASADCLRLLGVRSVRLLTNNPSKVDALRRAGIDVEATLPLRTSPHVRNIDYLQSKEAKLGHVAPAGEPLDGNPVGEATNVAPLLGHAAARAWRPYVVLKYAQTVDGRIATRRGDARWISSEAERRISHGLRAACDAVLVGVGTAIVDDPQLTVRMVPGSPPLRVVLDSTLRLPPTARLLGNEAGTIVVTTEQSSEERRSDLRARSVGVHVVDELLREERRDHASSTLDEERRNSEPSQRPKRAGELDTARPGVDDVHADRTRAEGAATLFGRMLRRDHDRPSLVVEKACRRRKPQRRVEDDAKRRRPRNHAHR
jgi:GTP cyclohydrolase II